MMKVILFVFATLLIMSCSDAQNKSEKLSITQNIEVVNAEMFHKKLENDSIQIIDVRTPDEFNGGTLEGAMNIDYYAANFKEEISKLDKDKTTLIFCHSGGRSGKASKILGDLGFIEVYDLKGGYSGWPFK